MTDRERGERGEKDGKTEEERGESRLLFYLIARELMEDEREIEMGMGG
jgi:hypothetical protein